MFSALPMQPSPSIPQDSPLAALRGIAPPPLTQDVVQQVTPPMEFRQWLELVKSYAEAATRRQDIINADVPLDRATR